jgi:glycosyltransferase involved in cell wall biosynthesis
LPHYPSVNIVVIASHPGSLVVFRGEMLKEMVARGHEVVAAAPDERESVRSWCSEQGIRFVGVPMARAGLDPIDDLRTLRSLHRVVRGAHADIVLAYTAKPVIYGLIAARLAGVPLRAAMISGRGSALAGGEGLKRRLLARLMGTMYAVSLRGAHIVFFQNPDDEAFFRSSGFVGRGQRRVRIAGSGVDLGYYGPAVMPDGPVTFLMVGRLLREKGVFEFVEAAGRVKAARPEARFQLLGGLDPNPTSISQAALDQLQEDGTVEYLGVVPDVRPIVGAAHVIVLPSYHEGMPRSVLEGMSMGRAIITTDAPGCRDTVEPGRNGFLVPVRDVHALAEAMNALIDDRALVITMGAQSRLMAEQRFDVHGVNRVILESLGL